MLNHDSRAGAGAGDQVAIELGDVRGPEARRLIDRLSRELSVRYNEDDEGTGHFKPEDVLVPRSGFLLVWVNGEAVGCGAFRPMEADVAEIKRMYVEPGFRGRGLARRLLAELEKRARQDGYVAVRLETGTAQPEAVHLYETAGYHRIASYGHYANDPRSVCFEKSLLAEG
jgi:ribosomal protein S18 acetylase RimI-like enzyme